MKYIKTFENYKINENAYDEVPVGTKVKTNMGIRRTGEVIPWFNWKEATDGTYSEPNRDSYVAVQWDNDEKGFSAVSNLIVIKDDGSEEELGRFISDEEYDTTSDEFTVTFDEGKTDSGMIEFEDGTIDNFIIYDDGKIGLEKWYPTDKDKLLVDKIKSLRKELFEMTESIYDSVDTLSGKQKELIELLGSIEDYENFLNENPDILNPVDKYISEKFSKVVRKGSINDGKELLSKIKEIDWYVAVKTARNNGISMPSEI